MKNLYFFINDSGFFPSLFNLNEYSSYSFYYWYNLPMKYDPKRVETSNIIGT